MATPARENIGANVAAICSEQDRQSSFSRQSNMSEGNPNLAHLSSSKHKNTDEMAYHTHVQRLKLVQPALLCEPAAGSASPSI